MGVTPTQVTTAERGKLHELITRHGGIVRSALTSACTHVVCGALTGAKVRCSLDLTSVHIVPPCWVTNSIRHGVRENEAQHRPQLAMEANSAVSPDMTVLTGYRSRVFEGQAFYVVDCPAAVEIKDQILRCGGALASSSEKGAYIISDHELSECDAGAGAPSGVLRRSSHWVAESAKFRTSEWSAVSLMPRGLLFALCPRSPMGI